MRNQRHFCEWNPLSFWTMLADMLPSFETVDELILSNFTNDIKVNDINFG